MKILALDLGDRWIGTALSDSSCLIARPYKTVERNELISFLEKLLAEETISEIVVGNPKTLRGTDSEQTKKILCDKEALEERFPSVHWLLWDERLTSKQATSLKGTKDKTEIHSVAAALILDSYLTYKLFQKGLLSD